MASERKMTPELITWQQRGFHPFTEVIEVPIKSGMDIGNFPSDQDFKSDATQILGLRAYINNDTDTAKSFLSKTNLLKKELLESAGVTLYESNSEKVYRMPLAKLVNTDNQPYQKIWIKGYSSKESKITLGKPVTEDCVVLIEVIYV